MADQVLAQGARVGQIAVVGDRDAAELELREQRLHIAQQRLAGRRVAAVPDRRVASELRYDVAVGENFADQTEAAMGMELPPVKGDDSSGLLSTMLQCMQAQRRMCGGVGMAVYAEDRAFFMQMVVAEGIGGRCHDRCIHHWLLSIRRCMSLRWSSP